jgi:hypothetical protein
VGTVISVPLRRREKIAQAKRKEAARRKFRLYHSIFPGKFYSKKFCTNYDVDSKGAAS